MILSEARFNILDQLYRLNKISKKSFVIYDDGCHVYETVNKYKRYKPLKNLKYFIDKFHLRGHVRNQCKTKFNQKLNKDISHLNSEICEQNFSLMLKHRYMLKHMSEFHFKFFIICIYDKLNEIIISKIQRKRNKIT